MKAVLLGAVLAMGLAASLAATQVQAAPETSLVTFTATGFTDQSGSAAAPADTVKGSFTLAGNTLSYGVSGITFDRLDAPGVSLSDPGVSTVIYSPYVLCPCVGGLGTEFADTLTGGNFQFSVPWPSFPSFGPVVDATRADASYFVSGVGTFETTSVVWSQTLLPEPSTWAMLMLGFGGVGFVLRNRHRGLLAAL